MRSKLSMSLRSCCLRGTSGQQPQALGSGIREGITGLAEGALGTKALKGAGKLLGLAVDFVVGVGADAAGQMAATGKADWKDSLQYGLTRAVTGGILGSGSAKNRSWKQNTARHGAAGSTGEVIRQLFEDPAESYQVSRTSYRQTRTPVEEMVPVMYPGNGMSCNGSSPLEMGIGFYKTRGYRYEQEPFTETVTVSGREPSLMERVASVAVEGIGEAVFGGLLPETVRRNDAALGAVSGSVLGKHERSAATGKIRNYYLAT